MKFYKKLSLNTKDPQSNRFAVENDNKIVTTSKVSLQLPAGTITDRPSTFVNGQIRYSATLNEFEVYNGSGFGTGWEIVRTVRPANITVQNLGSGDYVTTTFGPLQYTLDTNSTNYTNFQKPQNIMLYVENVYQIPFTNYTLVQGTGDSVMVEFTSPPPTKVITAILGMDGYFPPFDS
jgi:hypothetical protein